jgi:hypothetical protein
MNPEKFIVSKYPDLPGSKPVERAVQKEISQGEKGPSTKEERIETYLDRLEDFFKDPEKFEHLKYKILQKYTTRFEEIPESYWKSQEEEMRKRGEGGDWLRANLEQKLEMRQKHAEAVLADQTASLEQWLDYFSLSDSNYIPKEVKYWIFRNVANLKELVKIETQNPDGTKEERIEFPKRSKGTVSPFPDLNQEALSYIIDAIIKKLKEEKIEFEHDIQPQEQEEFRKFLNKEDFAKLYAWANEHMSPIPKHLLPITEGQWIKYEQGSDPKKLVETIRGRGTGWCTAGENTAKNQLETGDFYIYYSIDDDGVPTMPRIAIRMEGKNKIAENPRGIAYKQNLDSYIGEVLENKLKEFGQVGETYKKQSADMKMMTEIEKKSKANQELTKEDLIFLYEINEKIEGFGYERDPRIAEIRGQRNIKEDAPKVLDCKPEEIATNENEITENTKAYIGKLFPCIFKTNIDQIFTKFPEGKVQKYETQIGGKTKEELKSELEEKKIYVGDYAKDLLNSKDFTTSQNIEDINLVRLTGEDLGFPKGATTDEIYKKAEDFGLELCPAEVGPQFCLSYSGKEWMIIAMKPITDRDGYSFVFYLYDDGGRLELSGYDAEPSYRWASRSFFLFRIRKS